MNNAWAATRIPFLLALFTFLPMVHLTADEATIHLELLKGIPNRILLDEDIVGGGAPSPTALVNAKKQGIQSVIDLRTPIEGTMFEKAEVTKLGMKYFNIPIRGGNISEEKVEELALILSNPENRPALVHCSVGGRVHALWEAYQKKESK